MGGSRTVGGIPVLYLYDVPAAADLEHEFALIGAFLTQWNNGAADINGLPPNAAANPAAAAYVTKNMHISNSTPNERIHVTLMLLSAAGWASDPRVSNAVTHLYAINDDLAQGYDAYRLQSQKKNVGSSDAFKQRIADALANPL